jgi:hypothetical protein
MNLRPKVSSPSRPKFHLFPKLPTEIRFKTWKMANSSRTIHLKLQSQPGKLYWTVIASCPLNLLGVNREARSEILREYAQPFHQGFLIPLRTCKRGNSLKNLHFHWVDDILYVDIPENLEDLYLYWQRQLSFDTLFKSLFIKTATSKGRIQKFAINSTILPWFHVDRKSKAVVKSTKWETEGFKWVQEFIVVVTRRSSGHSTLPVRPQNDSTGSNWKKRIHDQFAAIKERRPDWKAPKVTIMTKRLSPPKSIKKRKGGRKC